MLMSVWLLSVALLLVSIVTSAAQSQYRNVTPQLCGRDFCDVLFPALDYSPFVGYAFYVRVRLYLGVVTSASSGPGVVALALRGAELSKEQGAAPAQGALPLGAFAIFLLKSAARFDAKVTYDAGAVVGTARLPQPPGGPCPANGSLALSCLESVELRQDLFESDTSKFTAYDARYWRRVVARHVQQLGARDMRLHVRLQSADALDALYYVNPLVQGAPLTELALEDVADVDKVELGPQAALRELSVAGVDVHRYEGLLGGAPHLRRLTLSRVGMTTPPSALLASLTRLEALDLSGNAGLDVGAVAQALSAAAPNLTSLSVADVRLGPGDLASLLRSFPRLRRLDAGGCSLRTLPPLDALASLRHLDLSRNLLRELPDDAFSSLAALRSLNLSGNALSTLRLLLPGVATLDALDLSGNAIEHPAALVGSGGGGVATVNLSGNPVVAWDDADAFEPWARRVDLSRCRVAFLSPPMRASLRALDAAILDGNPLDCEHCGVEEQREWLRATPVVSGAVCSAPAALRGRDVVDTDGVGVCSAGGGGGVNVYAVVLPLVAVVVGVGAALGGVVYVYRYEITYIKHLVKLRSRRRRADGNGGGGAFQYDAFVCYSGNDRNWVMKKLLPSLEQGPERYRLCLHERDFILGSIIARNIVRFMQESRNTIVILTDSFVKSQWCQWELDMANHKVFADDRDFLVFVELERLERRTLPRHLRYLMDTRTYLEWPTSADVSAGLVDEDALWKRLRTALGPSINAGGGSITTLTTTTTASSA